MKILLNLTGDTQNWLKRPRVLAAVVKHICECQVEICREYIRTHNVPPLYASGVRYAEEPVNLLRLGGHGTETVEEFACIPAVMERGWGDCFPSSTLLVGEDLRGGYKIMPIGNFSVGDTIWGLDSWTKIEGLTFKGVLPIDAITLNNGARLLLTADHKVYVIAPDGTELRTPVSALRQGMLLPQPGALLSWLRRRPPVDPGGLRVMAISREVGRVACWDIQTADHRVFLPEHDVTVSNCDDIAPWRCAELRAVNRERAKIKVSWRTHPLTGQRVYHVLVRRGDGSTEDPCEKLGMPKAQQAA